MRSNANRPHPQTVPSPGLMVWLAMGFARAARFCSNQKERHVPWEALNFRLARFGLQVLNANNVQGVQGFDEIIRTEDRNNIPTEQYELRMANFEFSAVGEVQHKWLEAARHASPDLIRIHVSLLLYPGSPGK